VSPRPIDDVAWQALERMPDGVAVFAPDWTIVYVNPAGAAVLDRTAEQLIGEDLWATFPEAVGTEFHTNLLAAANAPGGEPVRWSAHHGPVHGWFTDEAWRVGDQVVVVYVRADERRAAERTRQRLAGEVRSALARSQVLLDASEALQQTTTPTEVGEAVAALLGDDEHPPAYVDIAVLEPEGRHLRGIGPHVVPADVRERYRRVPIEADHPAAECLRTGRTIRVPDPDAIAARYADLRQHWIAPDRQAIACVPLPGPTGPRGVLVFVWARPRPADVGEEALLTTLGLYAGQAVTRLRVQEERLLAARTRYEDTRAAMLAMQRTLLPELPVLPGVRIEAHYVPAEEDTAAGGDWFDAIPLDGGRVALVVGDVVGHGAVAAATMGQLRAVTAHLLAEGADLPTVSAAVDRAAGRIRGARGASACLAVLDAAGGTVEWVAHGHPPPLLVDRAGARFLTGPPAGPVGVGPAAADAAAAAGGGLLGIGAVPATIRTARIPVGATLLLYTDGLVESRSRGLDDGLGELRRTVLDHVAGPGAAHDASPLSARLLARLGPAGFDDDVAVLAVQRIAAVEALSLVIDGRLPALRGARRALHTWLEPLDLDPDDVDNLLMAVSEALSNALEHAYPRGSDDAVAPGAAPVTLDAALGADGVLRVTVGDRGRWRRPSPEPGNRGRGLQMMRLLVDTVVLENDRRGGGTCVVLSKRLARAPVFGTAASPRGHRTTSDLVLDVERGEHPVVRARGVVDMVTAPVLRQKLLDVGRGGAIPVVLDLDRLDLLASAGVAVLHELRGQCALRLLVRGGSPVGRVLALTGLDDLAAPGPVPPTGDALLVPPR
jgi:anti-anti-sigma factor